MKKQYILVFMLLLLIGGILLYQWETYSLNKENKIVSANEIIYIEHKQGKMQIKQVIENLPSQQYKLRIPDKLKEVICLYPDNQTCSIENNHVEVNGDKITFTYTIPTKKKPKSFLLKDWLIQVEDVAFQLHTIQLSEFNWQEGTWVGNLQEVTKKEMDLVDYYYLEGSQENITLYWQQKSLNMKKSQDGLVLYAPNAEDIGGLNYKPVSNNNLYLILTNQHKELKDKQLWIKPSHGHVAIQELFAKMDIENTFTFKSEEKWLSDVIVAVLLNQSPKDQKAQKMYKELTQTLSKEKWKQWQESLRTFKQRELRSEDLDEMLGKVLGKNVKFFTRNAKKRDSFLPLFTYESRTLLLNRENMGEINVFHINGKWLLDAMDVLDVLNYQVQLTDKQIIQASKDEIHYKFYPNKRYFDLNKQRYGIDESPIVSKQETFMIDLAIIQMLFNVEVEQGPDTINMQQK